MKQYFLTADDKTPIIFNGMLCECTSMESGLQLGQTLSTVALISV